MNSFSAPLCDIVICGKSEIMRLIAEQQFDGIISILDPGHQKVWFPHRLKSMKEKLEKHCKKILQLQFWDTDDIDMVSGPRRHHIVAIREFASEMRGKKLAIHCMFGIARSPAAAIIVLRALGYPFDDAILYVKKNRPFARPNQLMLKLNDSLENENSELEKSEIMIE